MAANVLRIGYYYGFGTVLVQNKENNVKKTFLCKRLKFKTEMMKTL